MKLLLVVFIAAACGPHPDGAPGSVSGSAPGSGSVSGSAPGSGSVSGSAPGSGIRPDIPCTTCGGTSGTSGTSGATGGSRSSPAAVFCPQHGASKGIPLSLFTISWHHAAPANQPPNKAQVRQAADEFHALFSTLNPADLIVAVPASPYTVDGTEFEGSSVFKDELASRYHASLSEEADDNGLDLNNAYNHRNVAALVWGANWQLAQPPTLVSYETSDFCGVATKGVEGLFFGDFEVVRADNANILFHIIAVQTDAANECIRVNQINRAIAYATAHSALSGIPSFIIGDVNNENPASTNLATKAIDLLAGTMCDQAQDWTATSPAHPDMNLYELKASSGSQVTSIATVTDASNPVRTAHFTLPPIWHSVAGVQMSLALPIPATCNDAQCRESENSCWCARTGTCLPSRPACSAIH
jgi:hypothetical protein